MSNDSTFTIKRQFGMFLVGYARIVLAILSFYFMPTDYIVATIMYLLSILLDEFDGHAARYFNQCASPGFSIVFNSVLKLSLWYLQFQARSSQPRAFVGQFLNFPSQVFHNTLFILNFLTIPNVKI